MTELLQAHGVPAGAVQNAEDLNERDPQIAHRGVFFEMDHPVIGPARFEGNPFHLSLDRPGQLAIGAAARRGQRLRVHGRSSVWTTTSTPSSPPRASSDGAGRRRGRQQGVRGLRVVELAGDPAGEMLGKLLAQMGADVVKVEPPEGSPTRAIGPFAGGRVDPTTA